MAPLALRAAMNVSQYIETIRQLSYAMPAFRSIISINIGMVCSALLRSVGDARRAMLDCLKRGEAPFASHLLYTQALDDSDAAHRKLGI